MNDQHLDQNLVENVEPDPHEKELREFWKETGRQMVRGSIATIDEVGKQIIAVDGVLIGLYFNAIAFGDLRKTPLPAGTSSLYFFPVLFLLASLVAALLIFYPDRYKVDLRSSEAIRLVHDRTVTSKLTLLRVASVALLIAVLLIGLALFTYLKG